ncbi:MAG: GNAT family N-acetyltransferase [Hyphomicrobiales bacterium]
MMIAAAGENEQSEIATAIETALLASLATINTQAENNSFVLVSRGSGGALVGGVIGHTSYGWLLIKVLWVDESHRGTGLGKQLMAEVEGRARDAGCHSAWLDTSSEPAHAFYRHLGYADFGLLVNGADQKPAGHHRWFMKKVL